jgi:Transcription factor zinc-finger
MVDTKDHFSETLKLLDRAKEDIYFAEHDRQLIEKLRAQLKRVEKRAGEFRCPKCPGELHAYSFHNFILDKCNKCGGVWMDNGELEAVIRRVTRGPIGEWIEKLVSHD